MKSILQLKVTNVNAVIINGYHAKQRSILKSALAVKAHIGISPERLKPKKQRINNYRTIIIGIKAEDTFQSHLPL